MIMLDHVWSWFMPLIYSWSTFRGGLPLISKVSCVQRELLDFVIYRSSRKEISALKEQFNSLNCWEAFSRNLQQSLTAFRPGKIDQWTRLSKLRFIYVVKLVKHWGSADSLWEAAQLLWCRLWKSNECWWVYESSELRGEVPAWICLGLRTLKKCGSYAVIGQFVSC